MDTIYLQPLAGKGDPVTHLHLRAPKGAKLGQGVSDDLVLLDGRGEAWATSGRRMHLLYELPASLLRPSAACSTGTVADVATQASGLIAEPGRGQAHLGTQVGQIAAAHVEQGVLTHLEQDAAGRGHPANHGQVIAWGIGADDRREQMAAGFVRPDDGASFGYRLA